MDTNEKSEDFAYDLPDDNYGIFIVDVNDYFNLEEDDFGYDWVRNVAIDSYRAETKEELLTWLIYGLNKDTISDTNWFFLMDLKEEIILSEIPFTFN